MQSQFKRKFGWTAVASAAVLAAGLAGGAATAARAASFDGNWSVLVVTEKGDCDRAYRYEVRVAGGNVSQAIDTAARLSGKVGANGAVTVNIALGDKSASGSGRLRGDAGAGTWRGQGGAAACSGSWQAERR